MGQATEQYYQHDFQHLLITYRYKYQLVMCIYAKLRGFFCGRRLPEDGAFFKANQRLSGNGK